jgi:hypothetical protein
MQTFFIALLPVKLRSLLNLADSLRKLNRQESFKKPYAASTTVKLPSLTAFPLCN